MKVQIEIKETLSRFIEIECDNEIQGLEKVKDLYSDCEIVLDSNDFEDVEFYVL